MNGGGGGRVILVGAGPGDPGLMTERGRAALLAADDVVYDALVSARIVASCGARRHYVGKRAGRQALPQDDRSCSGAAARRSRRWNARGSTTR